MGLGDGVDQVGGGDGAHHAALPVSGLQEMGEKNGQYLVGGDEASVRVDDPETVRVPVVGEPQMGRQGLDQADGFLQFLFPRLGMVPRPPEKGVAVVVHHLHVDPRIPGAGYPCNPGRSRASNRPRSSSGLFAGFQTAPIGVSARSSRALGRWGRPSPWPRPRHS